METRGSSRSESGNQRVFQGESGNQRVFQGESGNQRVFQGERGISEEKREVSESGGEGGEWEKGKRERPLELFYFDQHFVTLEWVKNMY